MTKKQWTGILLLAAALLVGVFADIASARMAQGDAVGVGVSAATVPQGEDAADRPDIMLQQDGVDR
ncbi:MAG: hypothetical protein II093_04830 [Selenomonas sp.]|jgi:hypothetical protein|nr:hypothetical protein [Selenomonas sp.]